MRTGGHYAGSICVKRGVVTPPCQGLLRTCRGGSGSGSSLRACGCAAQPNKQHCSSKLLSLLHSSASNDCRMPCAGNHAFTQQNQGAASMTDRLHTGPSYVKPGSPPLRTSHGSTLHKHRGNFYCRYLMYVLSHKVPLDVHSLCCLWRAHNGGHFSALPGTHCLKRNISVPECSQVMHCTEMQQQQRKERLAASHQPGSSCIGPRSSSIQLRSPPNTTSKPRWL